MLKYSTVLQVVQHRKYEISVIFARVILGSRFQEWFGETDTFERMRKVGKYPTPGGESMILQHELVDGDLDIIMRPGAVWKYVEGILHSCILIGLHSNEAIGLVVLDMGNTMCSFYWRKGLFQ